MSNFKLIKENQTNVILFRRDFFLSFIFISFIPNPTKSP